LKVIPNPVNKYKELTTAKDSAASECYNSAVLSMLKNTRQDAKQAFFLFTDANTFSPGYRESIEMMQQAKINATLNVVVDPSYQNNNNWTFDQIIFRTNGNQFVKFYTLQQAQEQNLQRIDQHLRVTVNGFEEGRPYVTRNSQNYQDSVAVGEQVVKGQKRTIRQAVNAQMTLFQKQISATASLQLWIQDGASHGELLNSPVASQINWVDQWAICTGDTRAFPSTVSGFCNKSESYPAPGQLLTQAKRELDSKLAAALDGFYRNY
jgi:hypothetical protein